ncbi:polysaccharide pyruvyl transferase family protein [Devosia submarina]|uniref:polysaccharide pyruvyl transferase family protein n=1 Tax=Devosia submarina TaxID=1173082 RepID=UPI000D3AAC85|nr:polysaccharide pyruvyl transferase family protein [Devosia submarina]
MARKRVGLIRCSESLNIGNNFINEGAKNLLAQAFHGIADEVEFFEVEFFDSSSRNVGYTYPSVALTGSAKNALESSDLIIQFAGSVFNLSAEPALSEIGGLQVPKVLLGASAAGYCEEERQLVERAVRDYDRVILRDLETAAYFGLASASNVISGIDMAFFIDRSFLTAQDRSYAVVNLDPITEHTESRDTYVEELLARFPEVYVVENSATRQTQHERYVHIGGWKGLYGMYANAGEVVTTRVHTAVACSVSCTPFHYVGLDETHPNGKRASLFSRVGFKLQTGMQYGTNELSDFNAYLEPQKRSMVHRIRSELVSLGFKRKLLHSIVGR